MKWGTFDGALFSKLATYNRFQVDIMLHYTFPKMPGHLPPIQVPSDPLSPGILSDPHFLADQLPPPAAAVGSR